MNLRKNEIKLSEPEDNNYNEESNLSENRHTEHESDHSKEATNTCDLKKEETDIQTDRQTDRHCDKEVIINASKVEDEIMSRRRKRFLPEPKGMC